MRLQVFAVTVSFGRVIVACSPASHPREREREKETHLFASTCRHPSGCCFGFDSLSDSQRRGGGGEVDQLIFLFFFLSSFATCHKNDAMCCARDINGGRQGWLAKGAVIGRLSCLSLEARGPWLVFFFFFASPVRRRQKETTTALAKTRRLCELAVTAFKSMCHLAISRES